MPAAPPNAPSGSPDDPSSHWTGPTKGGVEYTNDASPVPLRIGRYSVIRLIGSGGMGAVYEAEQAQPKRRVALKLIRQAFAGESARVRFQQEAQHLAELDHPAIAKVYEAGAHAQDIGGPIAFIAMEYVQGGEAITRFARKRNLPLRARLELVAQVCDALHHAHERGVIHRDIKPANVLVADDGRPKIIDFGVARADMLAGERRPGVTLDGQMIGTLEYMAPEQCLADPNDPNAIDRRTDVYALGLLLYELVVGFMPYDVSRADIPTAINVIRETPPEPPRKSNPDLPKDVETIMLKALRKDRGERYATAMAMGDDLRRYLLDEAILARPETATQSVVRMARREVGRRPVATVVKCIALSALLACVVVLPLSLRLFPPLYSWYGARIAALSGLRPSNVLEFVAVVGRTDSTGNGSALAHRLGIENFDPLQGPSWRLLHGRLMERLAFAEPAVVAFDMYFSLPREEFDPAFVRGVQALAARGTPVIVGLEDLQPDEQGQPRMSPAIRDAPVQRGGLIAPHNEAGITSVTALVVSPRPGVLVPSWSLCVLAHALAPSAIPQFFVGQGEVEMRLLNPRAPNRAEHIRRIPVTLQPAAGPDQGVEAGSDLYAFLFDPLPRHVLDAKVMTYERVFELSDSELRSQFHNKAIVIANLVDPEDTRMVKGESQPGAFVQLSALASLDAGEGLQPIGRAEVAILTLLSAVVGASLGAISFRTPIILRTVVTGVLLTAVLIAGSVWGYRHGRIVFEPFTPLAGALVSAVTVSWLLRVRVERIALVS